ncbi:hypothetical protein N0V82_002110 [Gnomoniopsis sp. IMI 355080]|nr:hypothetical protein N0V82_002110 [Gnomoniopsis sp. IMI 355080]
MASRSIRGRRIIIDSSSDNDSNSDDEFPDLKDIAELEATKLATARNIARPIFSKTETPAPKSVRRRKLGVIADNPLLRPLGGTSSSTPIKEGVAPVTKKSTTPQRVELRTRKTKPVITSFEVNGISEAESIQEETIIEDFSGSDFGASESADEESDNDSTFGEIPQRSPSKRKGLSNAGNGKKLNRERQRSPSPSSQLLAEALDAVERNSVRPSEGSSRASTEITTFKREMDGTRCSSTDNLADCRSKFQLPKGLASPSKKISRIPATPHRSHTDTFWNQEFIDEWNDEHSPKKQLFPPSAVSRSPSKKSSSPKKGQPSQAAILKANKKAFAQSKHELAVKFLLELDERITDNGLSELSASTGGVRIEWTNKLHTTAGRANWKRETIKQKKDGETVSSRYRHHASIELSTKVIDDEHRLLNVIAHEFCHLANFMISGITTNPHGKEFKAWAAKVTAVFGDRNIDVTTKHSYDIDFKYVWECTMCGLEFKRHSKSINPERHRCGACKSQLKQTKPAPRATQTKESDYQRFMKEQMRLIKEENPGSPQKDIMRTVASRWAQRQKTANSESGEGESIASSSQSCGGNDKVEGVTKTMGELTIVDLT